MRPLRSLLVLLALAAAVPASADCGELETLPADGAVDVPPDLARVFWKTLRCEARVAAILGPGGEQLSFSDDLDPVVYLVGLPRDSEVEVRFDLTDPDGLPEPSQTISFRTDTRARDVELGELVVVEEDRSRVPGGVGYRAVVDLRDNPPFSVAWLRVAGRITDWAPGGGGRTELFGRDRNVAPRDDCAFLTLSSPDAADGEKAQICRTGCTSVPAPTGLLGATLGLLAIALRRRRHP